jgi:hypothetical protein
MAILYSLLTEKEQERRPPQYYASTYRDGIEVMNFFFDILNDYAGYTQLYYDELKMTEEEWKQMVKPMRLDHSHPYLSINLHFLSYFYR